MKNISDQKKVIPKPVRDIVKWQLSRKKFISLIVAGGLAANLPAANLIGQIEKVQQPILNIDQLLIITSVQGILFPKDEFGPGAGDINADQYLLWILADSRIDPEENNYIINGIDWVEETAIEEYSKEYKQLSTNDRERLIALISRTKWGENWLSVILTFIFEALLSDPQYGSNPNGIGWDWLNHNPGQPRPTNDLLYPKILHTIKKA